MSRRVDAFDLRILSALQRDGRITMQRLAGEVGLSASPCHTRIQKLEADKVIGPYRAQVNLNKLVYTVTAIVPLELRNHDARGFAAFERAIEDVPEVVECYAVGGGFDYVLRVVSKDLEAYQALMDGLLKRDIGILRYFSYFVTKVTKRFAGFPLEHLMKSD